MNKSTPPYVRRGAVDGRIHEQQAIVPSPGHPLFTPPSDAFCHYFACRPTAVHSSSRNGSPSPTISLNGSPELNVGGVRTVSGRFVSISGIGVNTAFGSEGEFEEARKPEHKFSVDAPVFVPSWMQNKPQKPQGISKPTYSAVVSKSISVEGSSSKWSSVPLCPYFESGTCDAGENCPLVHGLVCDLCGVARLHPYDEQQRREHRRQCTDAHEAAMEEAFGEARSLGKCCGICLENIRDSDKRFGILESCSHVFCLECIRHWRNNQGSHFDKFTVRSCPECRIHSDFVIPAKYWVEDAEDKKKLIDKFRENAKQKRCRYFRGGSIEECPFGNKCFYKHVMPDGTVTEGISPTAHSRYRPRVYDFIGAREALNLGSVDVPMRDAAVLQLIEAIIGAASSSSL